MSHEAAAVVRGFSGYGDEPVVIIRPHSSNSRIDGTTVHQISDCGPEHWSPVAGLPVTTAARTFVDLAATTSRGRLRHALEDAVSGGIVTLEEVERVLHDVARRGKPGVTMLVGVLDEQVGAPPGTSELERQTVAVLLQAGLAMPLFQERLPGSETVPGVVDFLYEEARLIVEADGRRWHDRRTNMLNDRDRDNRAAAAGYQTMRFMWERIFNDPVTTGELVSTTYHRRLRLLAA